MKYTSIVIKSLEDIADVLILTKDVPIDEKRNIVTNATNNGSITGNVTNNINPSKFRFMGFVDRTNFAILEARYHQVRDSKGRFATVRTSQIRDSNGRFVA